MLQGLDQRDKERYPLKCAINHTTPEPLIDRISDPVAQLKTHARPRFRDQLNKSVLFIYTGGRSARLQGLQKSESPREFFYGYPFFKEKGLKVDFVETTMFRIINRNISFSLFPAIKTVDASDYMPHGQARFPRYILLFQRLVNRSVTGGGKDNRPMALMDVEPNNGEVDARFPDL